MTPGFDIARNGECPAAWPSTGGGESSPTATPWEWSDGPGDVDQDVGRRRREHADGTSRRQLRDHLIGDRATSQVVHTRRIPEASHRGTPWQTPGAPSTNVTLATTAFAPAGTPPRPATGNLDEQPPATGGSDRSRPSVSQPHRSQRHEVRRRRHIPGNIDQDVGRRRREHADRTSRRQLRDHLIGHRATRQIVHTRRARNRPTGEHRGKPRRAAPTNVTLATTAFAPAGTPPRPATGTWTNWPPATGQRPERPGVGQPHRSQRHEVRRRRHIPGNIDQDVGRRRREHADRASRRQLHDHLIGHRPHQPSSSHSTCPEASHTGTPWRTHGRQHPPTSR